MSAGKKEKIFEGVMRLARSGADLRDVTVQQIADAAGVGKGTLYEYFSSRGEIIAATLRHAVETEFARIEAEFAADGSFDGALRCLCAASARCGADSDVGIRFALAGMAGEGGCAVCESLGANAARAADFLLELARRAAREELATAPADEAYTVFALRAAFAGCACAARENDGRAEEKTRRLVLAALRG